MPNANLAAENDQIGIGFIGSNSTAEYLANHYKRRFAFGNESQASGSGATINKSNEQISMPIYIGYQIGENIFSNEAINIDTSMSIALGNAKITYPDGISNFVEKISVESKSLELSPEISFSKKYFGQKVNFIIGFGNTFLWSEELFSIGKWRIYENVRTNLPSVFVSSTYKPEPDSSVGFYIRLRYLSQNPYLSFGIQIF